MSFAVVVFLNHIVVTIMIIIFFISFVFNLKRSITRMDFCSHFIASFLYAFFSSASLASGFTFEQCFEIFEGMLRGVKTIMIFKWTSWYLPRRLWRYLKPEYMCIYFANNVCAQNKTLHVQKWMTCVIITLLSFDIGPHLKNVVVFRLLHHCVSKRR